MPTKKKSRSLAYKLKKGRAKPPVVRAVVAVVPAAVSVEIASTTSKTKTKTTSSEKRAKTAAPILSSIKQRRIGFLLEEDISKFMDVLKHRSIKKVSTSVSPRMGPDHSLHTGLLKLNTIVKP